MLPAAKNALLRLTATVTGDSGRSVTFALRELDPNFGNHPAVLGLTQDGAPVRSAPALVVPGDSAATRSLPRVVAVDVGVQSPAATPPPTLGAVTVRDGERTVVLSVQRLARLPPQTLTVSFLAGGGAQQHTETGPALATLLRPRVAGHALRLSAMGAIVLLAVGWIAPLGQSLTGGVPLAELWPSLVAVAGVGLSRLVALDPCCSAPSPGSWPLASRSASHAPAVGSRSPGSRRTSGPERKYGQALGAEDQARRRTGSQGVVGLRRRSRVAPGAGHRRREPSVLA